jgi:hypothetical protein
LTKKENIAAVEALLNNLQEPQKKVMQSLHKIILKNLPKGFETCINYGMVSYVVPHSLYPDGYHCSPQLPLPFMAIAAQKNFIALYNMGMYANKEVYNWFAENYPKHCKTKLDAGKSCIRFKKYDDVPYELITELCTKFSPESWIELYKKAFLK